jgi:hypothetical protein
MSKSWRARPALCAPVDALDILSQRAHGAANWVRFGFVFWTSIGISPLFSTTGWVRLVFLFSKPAVPRVAQNAIGGFAWLFVPSWFDSVSTSSKVTAAQRRRAASF